MLCGIDECTWEVGRTEGGNNVDTIVPETVEWPAGGKDEAETIVLDAGGWPTEETADE